jgi:predicted patatin/cPLA2 family phospholipase
MNFRGKLSVLTALARGEPVLVIVPGGGTSCVYSLGVIVTLVLANLHRFIKAGIGVSGGAFNLAALFSNPERIETVIEVFEYLAREGFIRLKRRRFGRPYLVFDLEELIQTLEGKRAHLGLPALDEGCIRSHPSPFWVVATKHETGEGEFLDAKSNLFPSLRATASIQGTCAPVSINGVKFSDGQVGMKVGPAIRKVMARKVLIIMSRPPIEERGWAEQMIAPTLTRLALKDETPELREAAAMMDYSFSEELRRIWACQRLETLTIFPDHEEDIWPWTSDPKRLRLAYNTGRNYAERLIERAHAV